MLQLMKNQKKRLTEFWMFVKFNKPFPAEVLLQFLSQHSSGCFLWVHLIQTEDTLFLSLTQQKKPTVSLTEDKSSVYFCQDSEMSILESNIKMISFTYRKTNSELFSQTSGCIKAFWAAAHRKRVASEQKNMFVQSDVRQVSLQSVMKRRR